MSVCTMLLILKQHRHIPEDPPPHLFSFTSLSIYFISCSRSTSRKRGRWNSTWTPSFLHSSVIPFFLTPIHLYFSPVFRYTDLASSEKLVQVIYICLCGKTQLQILYCHTQGSLYKQHFNEYITSPLSRNSCHFRIVQTALVFYVIPYQLIPILYPTDSKTTVKWT